MLADGALVDLAQDPEAALARFTVLQLEGDLGLSPITELAAILSAFLPSFIEAAATGDKQFEPDFTQFAQAVMGRGTAPEFAHVYDMDADGRDFMVMVDPRWLIGGTEPDDLEGDLTVLGTVDRLVEEGKELSLARYVMPTMSRTMRRAMGKKGEDGLVDVLKGFGDATGQEVNENPLIVTGPLVIVEPIAIY